MDGDHPSDPHHSRASSCVDAPGDASVILGAGAGDAFELFEFCEDVFNAMAPFVHFVIKGAWQRRVVRVESGATRSHL